MFTLFVLCLPACKHKNLPPDIWEKEKLAVTDEDLSAEKEKFKAQNPGREADIDKYFQEQSEKIKLSLKEDKLFKFLEDNSKK